MTSNSGTSGHSSVNNYLGPIGVPQNLSQGGTVTGDLDVTGDVTIGAVGSDPAVLYLGSVTKDNLAAVILSNDVAQYTLINDDGPTNRPLKIARTAPSLVEYMTFGNDGGGEIKTNLVGSVSHVVGVDASGVLSAVLGAGNVTMSANNTVSTAIARFSGTGGKIIQEGYDSGKTPTINSNGAQSFYGNHSNTRDDEKDLTSTLSVTSDTAGNSVCAISRRVRTTTPFGAENGDTLHQSQFQGYNKSTNKTGASMVVKATEDFTFTTAGTSLEFKTVANTTTSLDTRLKIDGEGDVELTGCLTFPQPACEIYETATALTTITTQSVWTKAQFTTTVAGRLLHFTHTSPGRFTYTGAKDRYVHIGITFTVKPSSNTNTDWRVGLFKNGGVDVNDEYTSGAIVAGSAVDVHTSNLNYSSSTAVHTMPLVTNGDYFEVAVLNEDNNSVNVTFTHMNMFAIALAGEP